MLEFAAQLAFAAFLEERLVVTLSFEGHRIGLQSGNRQLLARSGYVQVQITRFALPIPYILGGLRRLDGSPGYVLQVGAKHSGHGHKEAHQTKSNRSGRKKTPHGIALKKSQTAWVAWKSRASGPNICSETGASVPGHRWPAVLSR